MIKLDVYVSSYKPVVSVLPEWNTAEQATWPASSVSLLTGEKEAVLIDALITFAEAELVVEWIRATGKKLVTVYITHGHGDHSSARALGHELTAITSRPSTGSG
jgi:glyoxylase-like metal-dependent hydrolase (beta-lactamase superfamily II)